MKIKCGHCAHWDSSYKGGGAKSYHILKKSIAKRRKAMKLIKLTGQEGDPIYLSNEVVIKQISRMTIRGEIFTSIVWDARTTFCKESVEEVKTLFEEANSENENDKS